MATPLLQPSTSIFNKGKLHWSCNQKSNDLFSEPFIATGYRSQLKWNDCCESVLSLHNQTLNIWTCFIPVALCMFLFIDMVIFENSLSKVIRSFIFADELVHPVIKILYEDKLVFGSYLVCLATAFLASALFHWFECLEDITFRHRLLSFDYSGIYLIGLGSSLPGIYYGFQCFPELQNFYMTLNVINGSVGFCLAQLDSFHQYRAFRTFSVCVGATIGVIFTTHLWTLLPAAEFALVLHPVIVYYLAMSLGLFFYVSRFPERMFPNCFDIWLHSHQLWHATAIFGIFYLYFGWRTYFEWKKLSPCAS